jgi:hypothetical protein
VLTLAFLVGGSLVVAAGCGSVAFPRLRSPGSTAYQQQRALQFDPYPDPGAGPIIDGMRPRDFDRPPAETFRGQRRWSEAGAPRWGSTPPPPRWNAPGANVPGPPAGYAPPPQYVPPTYQPPAYGPSGPGAAPY